MPLYVLAALLFVFTFLPGCFFGLPGDAVTADSAQSDRSTAAVSSAPAAGGDFNCFQMMKSRYFYFLLGIYLFGAAAVSSGIVSQKKRFCL